MKTLPVVGGTQQPHAPGHEPVIETFTVVNLKNVIHGREHTSWQDISCVKYA